MSFQTFTDILKWAWCYTPFPWLLVLLALVAVVWLWLEYQTTRLGRRTPGYHRPIPVLPEISEAAVYGIRISWLMVRLWVLLFVIMLVVGIAASQDWLPADVTEEIVNIGGYWRLGTIFLVQKLPDSVGDHLLPSESCAVPSWTVHRNTQTKKMDAREDRLGDLVLDQELSPTSKPHPTVSPTPTPTPSPAFQVIVLKNANVRAGPSIDAAKIGRAEAGERYLVTGRNNASTWWRILFKGKTGWIWHELVDSSAVPDSIPSVSP